MCGITAAIGQADVGKFLLEGLKRLEYRGYDSAGMATLDANQELERLRVCGKVNQLMQAYDENPLAGKIGLAHTRWATHGKPSENNAHPHFFQNKIALVHNGIIENYQSLREALRAQKITFDSETDSEIIVQAIGLAAQKQTVLEAIQQVVTQLQGAYAFVVMAAQTPDRIYATRQGAPLVIGLAKDQNFVASDSLALLPFTSEFIVLEEGDIAEIFQDKCVVYNAAGVRVPRAAKKITLSAQSTDRGNYRHYMQKEIFEQPDAISSSLSGRLQEHDIPDEIFGLSAKKVFDQTQAVHIVACGTSYHAGLLAKYWIEEYLGIGCQVDIASEIRYKNPVIAPGTLYVTLSQSGETADTLAAFRALKSDHYCGKLVICNVPESALVQASDLVLLTHAGPEIGVASTKGFSTQLVALLMLVQCLGSRLAPDQMAQLQIVKALKALPHVVLQVLALDKQIADLAQQFDGRAHALFVARGLYHPVVMEGALKLKEISYIHAEAYPAGELKHGPLALVDKHMPVVAVVADDKLADKMASNLQEISARQGAIIAFVEKGVGLMDNPNMVCIDIPKVGPLLAPFAFSVALQLLAYHVAVMKGTDVDQPRNLAKSVTVE